MGEVCVVGIKLDDDYCGRCLICPNLCPYEAISVDSETDSVKIDVEKCQFCGICYSACPVSAIEIVYYDYNELLKRVEKLISENKAETIVLMCRGNSPPTGMVEEILEEKIAYIPLRVPCVGRIPTEFILETLVLGIKRVVAIRCEEDFCRFKEGSRIGNQRLLLTKQVLKELGYPDDTLKVITYARKVVYHTDKCVGCDKCVFICPYDAITADPLATPNIDLDKCVGCGACALVCPHQAIEVEGFEYENIESLVKRYAEAAKTLKSKGVSPNVLVFSCQWSEFPALDKPETRLFDNRAFLMEIPCFKGLDPFLVIKALYLGFDGVMAVVCSDEDCKLEEGYDVAERNTTVLNKVLEEFRLRDRFKLHTLSPRNVGDFKKQLESFINEISKLPLLTPKIPVKIMEGETHV